MFPDPVKLIKKIKKAKTYTVYDDAVKEILDGGQLVEY